MKTPLHRLWAVAGLALGLLLTVFWQACLQPAPPVKYYEKEPEVRVGLLLKHKEIFWTTAGKFTVRDAQGNILAQDLSGKLWRVRAASAGATSPALEMREIGGTQSFIYPSGIEIEADYFTATDSETDLHSNTARSYLGRLRFMATGANVTAVNILPVEDYLRGVVPAEMSPSFPTEALKAQAVACRSEVLHRLQQTSKQDYDICADEGCQVYAGTSRNAETVDKAIRGTHGLVLKVGGQIAPAPYAGVCGGFTENNEAVWSGKAQPHLRGRFDGKKGARTPPALHSDQEVQRWLAQDSGANCDLQHGEVPRSLAYARGYFRWQRQFTAAELAASIKRKTGEDPGALLDLVVLQRGFSGRVTKMRVTGSKKSFEMSGELNIRQALSASALPSALFVLEKTPNSSNGAAEKIVIQGGGWGHGVGMCQVGAAQQALHGRLYQNILEFYYKNARLARAY